MIRGNNLNIFQKFKRLRKTAFFIAVVALALWVVMGFDSTIGQIIHPLYSIPQLLTNQISTNEWTNLYFEQYGREMHWSAFVIYGLCFWGLSRHYDKHLNIQKSKNVAYAMSLTLFAVAVFEFYWMFSFAHFQNQAWVITPRLPQLRIHLQNLAFLMVGGLAILYIFLDSFILKGNKIIGRHYTFNWNWKALALVGLSIGSAVFWWNYPFQVERFSVVLETGEVWSNTNRFPQTLYTIDLNPNDNVNAGVWFWMENNLVHAVNTLVKVFWTLSVFYVGRLRKVV